MDTSKEYIKMCEKWWEQAEMVWEPASGDFVYCPINKKVVVLYFNEIHGKPPIKYVSKPSFPLPRQDQLQEIAFDDVQVQIPYGVQRKLFEWCQLNMSDKFTSMEQLWLAFVMKEKFSKTWDGETWQSK